MKQTILLASITCAMLISNGSIFAQSKVAEMLPNDGTAAQNAFQAKKDEERAKADLAAKLKYAQEEKIEQEVQRQKDIQRQKDNPPSNTVLISSVPISHPSVNTANLEIFYYSTIFTENNKAYVTTVMKMNGALFIQNFKNLKSSISKRFADRYPNELADDVTIQHDYSNRININDFITKRNLDANQGTTRAGDEQDPYTTYINLGIDFWQGAD